MRFKVDFSQWAGSIFRRRGKLINARMNFIMLTATSLTSKLFAESSLVRLFSQCVRNFVCEILIQTPLGKSKNEISHGR